ncbi:hypothetical protein PIB30_053913 [Stylosanthes scabra]|uniref:Putative plant transposon protein domain-containing protein n=1 Tax=Stylosanthes scabra TaxID=79078 RepID=A0ABU6ZHC1_9FABA|nr:hypothetical protein [Stylosanthes scabra]
MAGLLKKRKEKAVAQSSSEIPRFKSPFHEADFKGKLSARKVLPKVPIDLNDDILSPCAIQIRMRKWEKFTAPLQAVGHNLVKEFYANAWEPEKAKRKPYTYTTMVQGTDISFAPRDIKTILKLKSNPFPNAPSYHERKANKDYRLEEVQECLCLEGREWFYKFIYKTNLSSSLPFPSIIAALCLDAKVTTLKDDTLINQELPIAGEALIRTREGRARNPRQEAPPPQQLPQVHPQPQVHQQQEIPSNFYTHFDASMSQIYRRLDQQQEETRQFREMEAQGVPVTIANLSIHRHREEEMNRERMRHNQTVQEAASQRAREAKKGKAREVVPDSEEEESEEMYSSPSEEW